MSYVHVVLKLQLSLFLKMYTNQIDFAQVFYDGKYVTINNMYLSNSEDSLSLGIYWAYLKGQKLTY